jgi:4-diphosphocytidyl-2-C-methyl-D-erythritol kinase
MQDHTQKMKILAPAKINLFLKITGKRPDGYHDLLSLICCVGLYDSISLSFGFSHTTVQCNVPGVPNDGTNLAHRAAVLFLGSINKTEGVKITIEKRIPVAAGLGGGSSNAASVLLGLNRHYGSPFSRDELMTLSLPLGADVPFFIFGRPAIASGIGEKLKAYEGLTPFSIVLVYPGFGVSTADVYKNLNLELTKCKKKLKQFQPERHHFDVNRHLCNDLETVTASKYPDVIAAKEALLKNGANGALMSGSGSTVFGIFADAVIAKRARYHLAQNKKWQVFLADTIV